MKTYVVVAHHGIELKAGLVTLTEAQVANRKTKLSPVEGRSGVYEITAPTMFKKGERIGYDGELSKVMASQLVDPAQVAKQEEAAAAAEKKATKASKRP